MGLFSRFGPPKVPRWGFPTAWSDFVTALAAAAQRHGLHLGDEDLKRGVVELPEDAAYEAWDLRDLARRCAALEPHAWADEIRRDLAEAYGKDGDVDLVDGAPDDAVRARQAPSPAGGPRTRQPPPARPTPDGDADLTRLRVQLFGEAYLAATGLDRGAVVMRPFGDAWLCLVADLGGSEATVRWVELASRGLDPDAAFARGLANAVADTGPRTISQPIALPDATGEILVSDAFYLSGVVIAAQQHLGPAPRRIVCPLTWHHWLLVTLTPAAGQPTVDAIRALVAQLAAEVEVTAAERIGTSLWWWPDGAPPQVLADGAPLPDAG